jgi:hypothetical protein
MKTQTTITLSTYFDTDHEAILNVHKQKLLEKVKLQGKQDGQSNYPTSPEHHRALVLNLIEVILQNCIDINQRRYLPISGMVVANMISQEAENKKQALRKDIKVAEHALIDARTEALKQKPDVKFMQIRKFVFAVLVVLGVTESILSFPAFRHSSFPTLQAYIASMVVGALSALIAHHLGGAVKKAQTGIQKIVRYTFALVVACVGFGALAILRADAFNKPVYILSVGNNTPTVSKHNTASALAIATISILFFMGCVFLSAQFFRTKAERIQETAYSEACELIAALENTIAECKAEIDKIESETEEQKSLALVRFEYAKYTETQIINFSQVAAEEYKQHNMIHRTDGCPAFLAQKPLFHFTRFFDTLKQSTHEPA